MTQVHTRSLKCKCRSWKHNLSLEVKRTNGCLWMPTKMLFYLELWPNAPQDFSHPTAFQSLINWEAVKWKQFVMFMWPAAWKPTVCQRKTVAVWILQFEQIRTVVIGAAVSFSGSSLDNALCFYCWTALSCIITYYRKFSIFTETKEKLCVIFLRENGKYRTE